MTDKGALVSIKKWLEENGVITFVKSWCYGNSRCFF